MRAIDPLVRVYAALRLLGIVAVGLALSGLPLPLPSASRTVIVLFDASDSLGPGLVEEERAAAGVLIDGLGPGDRVRMVAFAGKPLSLGGPWERGAAKEALASLRIEAPMPESTDIGAAVQTALSLAAADRLASACIVLLGDVRTNAGGEALPAMPGAAARVPVFVIPFGRKASGVTALGLNAPDRARPGQDLSLTWRIASGSRTSIAWDLLVDGSVARTGRADLAAGTNEIAIPVKAGQAGFQTLEARVLGDDGSPLDWAASGAAVAIEGPPSVLVVSSRPGASPIVSALAIQGIAAREGGIEALPDSPTGYAGLSAVVLDDIPALAMTEAQQSGLGSFASLGGGILFVGGPSSFGRGEYYATALEDILPVETDTRQRLFFTRARLLFVIDHSGSMAQAVGAESKQVAAMRGVEAAIRELNPDDEVGILSFDSSPTWVLPFTPASKTASIDRAISTIPEGGGTDLDAAIRAGIQGFGPPGPAKRHMIVLTDGLSSAADKDALSAALKEAGISLSAIAIGHEVNEDLLKGLAEGNGGAYYRVDEDRIPKILDEETVRLTRDLIQEGRIGLGFPLGGSIVEGLDTAPAIRGYVITKAKPLASVWMTAEAEGGRRDPILATWRWGSGIVASFASDSGGRWLGPWRGRAEYNRLWSQLVRAIEGPPALEGLRVAVTARASDAFIVAEARRVDGRTWSGLRLVARDSEGGAVALEETAPGRYEGRSPLAKVGLHRFDISGGEGRGRAAAWLWYQPGMELALLGPDIAAASFLAGRSGGAILDPASALLPPPQGLRLMPARTLFAVLALLLLLLELYFRSAMAGQVLAALGALSAWMSKSSLEAERLRNKPYAGIPTVVPGGDDGRR